MNQIIYSDVDVRPDLLTAEERSRFPAELSNEDRRSILAITRGRMDNVDYDGHRMPSPEEWTKLLKEQLQSGEPLQNRPELREEIKRDVVLPQTGEVKQVDAGIADIVQRLLDRGVVVDIQNSKSGMVTDHPGMRWIHQETTQGRMANVKPGEHIFDTQERGKTILAFPTGAAEKVRNDAPTADVIREAACKSGLVVIEKKESDTLNSAIEVRLPHLMDGSDYYQFMAEAAIHARAAGTEGHQAWVEQIDRSKQVIAERHGGVALYSDDMISDRISRFERTVQRLMVNDQYLSMRQQPKVNYADYLTGEQYQTINIQATERLDMLWKERRVPYQYQYYKNTPEEVDEVARMAGFKDFDEYRNLGRNRMDGNKWMNFQKLERQHLTHDEEGVLKLYRIGNGIQKDVARWTMEQQRNIAVPVIDKYQKYGYPVKDIAAISLITRNDGTAEMLADIKGRPVSRMVSDDCFARLISNASTPFEVALETYKKELGWRGNLHIPVSVETVKQLNLETSQGSGQSPLSCDGLVYLVGDRIWQQAAALTRFERMPEVIQQQVLDMHPPVRSVRMLSPDEVIQRVGVVIDRIDNAVTDMKVISVDDAKFMLRCKIDGADCTADSFTMKELDFSNKFLPGDSRQILSKELLAARHPDAVFHSQDRQNSFKR